MPAGRWLEKQPSLKNGKILRLPHPYFSKNIFE
jgi:hypothetical protein